MLWILGLIFVIFYFIIFPEGLIVLLISFSIGGFIFWLINSKVSFKIKVPITILILIGIALGGYYWWTDPDREHPKYLEEERRRWAEWNTPPSTPPKDSIDYIIEERLATNFNDKIFAGIYLGDNPAAVKQKLKKYKRIYGDTIFLPTNSSPKKLIIGRIHQEYYKHKLYKLEICYNTNYVDSALLALYSSKYGKTKKDVGSFLMLKYPFIAVPIKLQEIIRGIRMTLFYTMIT